jgi:hypothetical protein
MLAGPSFQEQNILVGRRIQDLSELAFDASISGPANESAAVTLSARLLPAPKEPRWWSPEDPFGQAEAIANGANPNPSRVEPGRGGDPCARSPGT